VTALNTLAQLPSSGWEGVDKQAAAPAETRIPNLHRAKNRSPKSADGRVATVANRLRKNKWQTTTKKNQL